MDEHTGISNTGTIRLNAPMDAPMRQVELARNSLTLHFPMVTMALLLWKRKLIPSERPAIFTPALVRNPD